MSSGKDNTISASIPKKNFQDAKTKLEENFPDIRVEQKKGLNTNKSLGQIEWMDIIIHVAATVALEEVIGYIKNHIKDVKMNKNNNEDKK